MSKVFKPALGNCVIMKQEGWGDRNQFILLLFAFVVNGGGGQFELKKEMVYKGLGGRMIKKMPKAVRDLG